MSIIDYKVKENGIIEVRTITTVEGSNSIHRHTLAPGADLTGQDAAVVTAANEAWTQEVLDAYNVLDPAITLDMAQAIRIHAMEMSYSTALDADVTYNSVIYQSGDYTRQNLSEAISNYVASANALPDPFTWRAKDNSDVAFTTTDIKALAALIGTQKTTAIYNLHDKKDAINAAADVAAVNAINWS